MPSSALRAASSFDRGVISYLVELLLDVVAAAPDVFEDAGLEQFVESTRPGLHGGDLVLGSLEGGPGVVERLGDARRALVDEEMALAAVYCAFIVSF